MTIVEVNDTELYYEEHGSGVPFLVMHGGLGIDHTYLPPALDPLGDIFQLIYYDHRGHGRSGRPPLDTITYEQLADDADGLREILGHKKIGVIGNSAGGYVALHYAIRHPNNISCLILIDSAPAFDYMEEIMANIQRKNPTPEMIETIDAPVATTIEGFRHQFRFIQPLYFYEFTSEMEDLTNKLIKNMILNPEVAALNDVLTPKYNVSSQLNKIEAPTLILVGEEDFICPPSQAQRMLDGIPNSELFIFEKSGHNPFYEEPDVFLKVVSDWFKRVHNELEVY
jgi:proline iminopeptidase